MGPSAGSGSSPAEAVPAGAEDAGARAGDPLLAPSASGAEAGFRVERGRGLSLSLRGSRNRF